VLARYSEEGKAVRPRIALEVCVAALLLVALCACAEPVGSPSWGGPVHYGAPRYYSSPTYYAPRYYGSPGYYAPRYYGGSTYQRRGYVHGYRAPPAHGWAQRQERTAAPRTEHWSQERLRQHWQQLLGR
jgi:hypothetical protein